MYLLYGFFIHIYQLAFRLTAWFNPKAKLAVEGRKNWEEKLQNLIDPYKQWIWMHCSSLGEFEQGRPVFEALKAEYPEYKFALSFFSPSGYEIRKDYALADVVFYLPFDTAENAKKLSEIFQPELWILVKYDYWYNHLKFQNQKGTKIIVISAIFRENQIYFKPFGKWLSSELKKYISHFFVQDELSLSLLQKIDIEKVTVSGDTRFDRVKAIAQQTEKLSWIEEFKGNKNLVVVGSSWKEDEELWVKFINETLPKDWKVVIVPHEIRAEKIQKLKESIQKSVVLFSELTNIKIQSEPDGISAPLDDRDSASIDDCISASLDDRGSATLDSGISAPPDDRETSSHDSGISASLDDRISTPLDDRDLAPLEDREILIVDAIGFLSKIYASANIAYVGGGFNKSGVHNTLEPAVFGVPVVIGPNFEKFNEVKLLKENGVIYSFSNYSEFKNTVTELIQNEELRLTIRNKASKVFDDQLPSTQIILNHLRKFLK